ncbi:MAG: 3-oxoadipyl-CoA/3-oxo-5,6-dehydrosuberyl-CoA thiolase [Phycisphaerae bacterium]|nr:3-oxoadipyl-CoA/3-oxo-5,6-dehydrosuberyl-CoA thiolase [Phycisphaerae bacterium]
MQRRAAIVAAVRTPIGKYGGALSRVRPDDLAAVIIRALMERSGVDSTRIDDVYFGAANQAGEDNRNVARMAVLLAGLPVEVPGSTVNRLCASSLDALHLCARLIEADHGDVFIAGGVESMSRAPFVLAKSSEAFDRRAEIHDTTIGWRFINKQLADQYYPYSMGETAENVAKHYQVSREDQDRFALQSQQRYQAALTAGKFADELIPVTIPQARGEQQVVAVDEHPRPEATLEALARLKPAFTKDGTVTAGNASGINDGAAGLLLVELQIARKWNLPILAVVGPGATAGVDPAMMGLGPIPATRKAIARGQKTGLLKDAGDIDLVELNEAFASQSLICIRELGLNADQVNVNGGAIALGHPLGCSGARIATTLVHEMRRRQARIGLATMCVGVGQGVAVLFESPAT